jgi:ribosome small subunit-dependent GTPase A
VDVVVILAGLDQEFNLQRIERWLCLAHEGGCTPLVLLSKAGLVSEEVRRERVAAVERVALGVEVLAVDVVDRLGLPELDAALPPGQTIVLVGSSGVGKSTLLNYVSGGDVMRTGVVSAAHGKGRHTTSHRELVVLEERELVVLDTPGLREVGLWGAGEGLARTFAEVAELALGCRFSDCTHVYISATRMATLTRVPTTINDSWSLLRLWIKSVLPSLSSSSKEQPTTNRYRYKKHNISKRKSISYTMNNRVKNKERLKRYM